MINRYASLKQGLVGCWIPSLGASGYRLLDRSGKNNHGTLTNMDPGTDWVPNGGKLALDFDGVDDVVTCPQPQYSYPVTINFWVRIVSVHNAYVVVLTNGATTDASFGFVSSTQDLRLVGFQLNHGNLTIGVLSNWTMLTYSLESQTYRTMYINGAFSISNTTSAALPTMSSIRIGGGDFGGRKLNGALDDVRVYNRVLTPQEIRLLYTGGRGVGLMPERIKHRRKTTAAATNRRRRLICGANC